MLNETIKNAFAETLNVGGVGIENMSTGHTFRGLVVASSQDAEFSIGEQDLTETISATCFRENAPKTGNILEIDGSQYAVTGIQRRLGSPIIRIHMQLESADDADREEDEEEE